MDYSPPGSAAHGIIQVRILEWIPMPSSRGSSRPRDRTHNSYLLHWQVGSSPPLFQKVGYLEPAEVLCDQGQGADLSVLWFPYNGADGRFDLMGLWS